MTMPSDGAPKTSRISIQKKYKRRVRTLSRALDQYLHIARAKLDESQSGKIYNRTKIQHLALKCTELAGMIAALEQSISRTRLIDQADRHQHAPEGRAGNTLIDGDEFFKGLTQQEWDELRRAFNKDPD